MTHEKVANTTDMLTRSKARAALAREKTTVLVAPSATGRGTHTRWHYPSGHVVGVVPSNISPASSLSSFSYSSSSSSSSASFSSPEGSFDYAPNQPPAPPTVQPSTPRHLQTHPYMSRPPATPLKNRDPNARNARKKKLQRSPAGYQCVSEGGHTRLVLVEDSFTPEAVNMRESIVQIQIDAVADREMEALLRQRDLARLAMDMEDSEMDSVTSNDSRSSFSSDEAYTDLRPESYLRGDTAEVEDMVTTPSMYMVSPTRKLRRLGPTGTELIEPVDYTSYHLDAISNTVYPESWRKAVQGQPTEPFIR
ncbi:hypothetical protein H0H81_012065 [Sphagnurus paluster]|uniref:Uncharacterized protein n=1 Tax=Sphagnurus paluster TaxID=117069 RepID=A0A9P7K271_9AGAR|nr:hypothetical protein H0H81_012065 [Sphagnurus paluster]